MSGTEIIRVVEQVVSTGLKIYSVYCAVRDAPGEIRDFCNELQCLNQVLTHLSSSMPDTESEGIAMPGTWRVELPVVAAASDEPVDSGATTDGMKLSPVPDVPPRSVTPQLAQLEKAIHL